MLNEHSSGSSIEIKLLLHSPNASTLCGILACDKDSHLRKAPFPICSRPSFRTSLLKSIQSWDASPITLTVDGMSTLFKGSHERKTYSPIRSSPSDRPSLSRRMHSENAQSSITLTVHGMLTSSFSRP
eukprot:scaffold4883_cov61-Cylindrotheca_fusiformis.AAC.4